MTIKKLVTALGRTVLITNQDELAELEAELAAAGVDYRVSTL